MATLPYWVGCCCLWSYSSWSSTPVLFQSVLLAAVVGFIQAWSPEVNWGRHLLDFIVQPLLLVLLFAALPLCFLGLAYGYSLRWHGEG